MERVWWLAQVAVREQEGLREVRKEVHAEIEQGGKAFSERQRELTSWQQGDVVPTLLGLFFGCSCIMLCRRLAFFGKAPRPLVLVPAVPCYLVPYQVSYHVREAEYLIEMMREDKQKFAKRLRAKFQVASGDGSAVLDDLESGYDIDE
ncbi:unnamed protein product [Effrenium voratum]|uniref:Uncharacterized protein n=1 Tax=Effrenium voratum TaxID=2562239 RepID=A0AA36JDF3_9DINO|nr:unnamed protein product [Effrenium voratum]CAJ1435413.1 unnamed protein product [Effrenium voratum]